MSLAPLAASITLGMTVPVPRTPSPLDPQQRTGMFVPSGNLLWRAQQASNVQPTWTTLLLTGGPVLNMRCARPFTSSSSSPRLFVLPCPVWPLPLAPQQMTLPAWKRAQTVAALPTPLAIVTFATGSPAFWNSM